MQMNVIRMRVFIYILMGSQVEHFNLYFTLVPGYCFDLGKKCRPRQNATLRGILSGLSLFAKVPIYEFP